MSKTTLRKRVVRLSILLQEVMSDIIKKIKELDMYFITIIKVDLAENLLKCKVYYSILDLEENKQKVINILKSNIKKIKLQLASRLNLKHTPDVFFVYDYSNEQVTRVYNILEKIKNEHK
ncbi:MAG: 30S ribosome-binding factor RbfA [Endomicrobium sp.]|jgi:ribosome-binding factor A|nr:30S ribosome-binding factor RbfA [Endomicrobium sp.]